MYLRRNHKYHAAKRQEHLIAVGKEFYRNQLRFEVIKNEGEFFEIVKNKTYYCHKASILWRSLERVKGKLYNKLSLKGKMNEVFDNIIENEPPRRKRTGYLC